MKIPLLPLLLLTFLLILFYRRFKSYLSKSSKNKIVSDKKITKVNYDKVRDADFEDLDEQ
ncbi:MAG: hypothetical protein Ct9H300mP24_1720 [Candidatus Neomarinimicrobiota bacterium]|nr:MAG: hypothetical protein Ct9H300mP24_1720 [Candidatus Neomarinimicrobiota bacterium]